MAKRNTKPARPDPDFVTDMQLAARERLNRGLARMNMRDLSFAEMTRLLRRTQGYRMSLEELKSKPKRENLKR
jgi:hypothetical protein